MNTTSLSATPKPKRSSARLSSLVRRLPTRLRGFLALSQFGALTLGHGVLALVARVRHDDSTIGERHAARWARAVVGALPLEIVHHGQMAHHSNIVVANHRSYIDVLALLHGGPCGLLAKAEVAHWPLIGWAVRAGGTLFVVRDDKDSRSAARDALTQRALAGGRAALFPEGTTSAEPGCLPFRPGIFHAAVQANLAVQPVALHYPDTAAPYVGDDSFLPHFLGLFRRTRVRVHAAWGPVLRGDNGEVLRQQAEAWVRGALAELNAADPVAGAAPKAVSKDCSTHYSRP
ncbi:MAG: 1-acyl-sn-glycerol-3-phosphate acyltransferase [Myxococcales bacterium]|nr:1-acyl-sn-glycerol-3-phosphate acyltransferase [Myxococcales bacterium]